MHAWRVCAWEWVRVRVNVHGSVSVHAWGGGAVYVCMGVCTSARVCMHGMRVSVCVGSVCMYGTVCAHGCVCTGGCAQDHGRSRVQRGAGTVQWRLGACGCQSLGCTEGVLQCAGLGVLVQSWSTQCCSLHWAPLVHSHSPAGQPHGRTPCGSMG